MGATLPWSLALGQPLLALVATGPTFLVAHHAGAGAALLMALAVCLGPGLAFATLHAVLGVRAPRLAGGILAVGIGLAVGVMVLQALIRKGGAAPLPFPLVVGAAAFATFVAATLAYRHGAARDVLARLSPVALVPVAVFLLHPGLRGLVRPAGGWLGGPATDPAPVVVVVLDELPLVTLVGADGLIDGGRFPAFARLAARADWYRNATTVAQSTAYAVPAILDGRYPDGLQLPTAADHPRNLFTVLAAAGWALEVVEPHTDLCPPALCAGGEKRLDWAALWADLGVLYAHLVVPPPFASQLPAIGESWRGFATARDRAAAATGDPGDPDDEAVDDDDVAFDATATGEGWRYHDPGRSFEHFVATLELGAGPSLHFLHVMLPHMPWRYLPSGKRYESLRAPREPHGLRAQRWVGTDFEVAQAQQRHVLQTAYVDRVLGRLLDRLEASGRWDELLLVVVADHGAAFQRGLSRRNVRAQILADIVNVPLFLKRPGQHAGRVDDRPVQTVDILPTIAAVLGIELGDGIDGRSLLDSGPLRETLQVYRTGLAGRGAGRPHTFALADVVAGRATSVANRRRRFGDVPEALFALGDDAGWVGRVAGDLVVGPPRGDTRLRLDHAAELADVDPGADELPVHLTGTFEGADPPPRVLIAVGGVVRAVVEPYRAVRARTTPATRPNTAPWRLSAMIDERALRPGANPVEAFGLAAGEVFVITVAAPEPRP